jgi:hypothetical protein
MGTKLRQTTRIWGRIYGGILGGVDGGEGRCGQTKTEVPMPPGSSLAPIGLPSRRASSPVSMPPVLGTSPMMLLARRPQF